MNHTTMKHALDALSVSAAAGAFVGILPPVSAGLSIIWLSIQIIEWYRNKRK